MHRMLLVAVVLGLLALMAVPAFATPNGSILPPTMNSNASTVTR